MTDLAVRPEIAVQISPHAWARLKEMGLGHEDVVEALSEPEFDRPDSYDPGRRKAKRGRIEVLYALNGDQRVVVTVLWSGEASGYEWHEDRADPTSTASRASETVELVEPPAEPPSKMNGIFLSQLGLWGCNEGRRNGDWVNVRAPTGVLFKVRPADHPVETKPEVAEHVYDLLGVTAEQFWSRTSKVRTPRERLFAPRPTVKSRPVEPVTQLFEVKASAKAKALAAPKHRRGRGRPRSAATQTVMDFFQSRPGVAFEPAQIAEQVEVDLTACRRACLSMAKTGHLRRVGPGRYRWAGGSGSDSDVRLAEINAELVATTDMLRRMELIEERGALLAEMSPSGTRPPVPEGERFFSDERDEEIDALLELVAPDGVPYRHYDAAERWRHATRAFIEELRT